MLEVGAVQAQTQHQRYLLCHGRFVTPCSSEPLHCPGRGCQLWGQPGLGTGLWEGRQCHPALPSSSSGTRGGAGQLRDDAPHQNLSQRFGWGHRHRWEIFTAGVSHLTSSTFNTGAAGGLEEDIHSPSYSARSCGVVVRAHEGAGEAPAVSTCLAWCPVQGTKTCRGCQGLGCQLCRTAGGKAHTGC